MAEKFRRKTEGELAAGTYERHSRITWRQFRQRFEETTCSRKRGSTVQGDGYAFDHFERISEILALRWQDLDLQPDANGECWATTRADDNKGGRTERIPLLPIVVKHLRMIRRDHFLVLPWALSHRALYPGLNRIAKEAGVKFPHTGRRKDKFHALRKTFGTRAALAGVNQKALTALMRHRSYSTTERYYLDAEALMSQAMDQIEVSTEVRKATDPELNVY